MFFHLPQMKPTHCIDAYMEDYYPLEEIYDMITCGERAHPQQRDLMVDYHDFALKSPTTHLRALDHDSRDVLAQAIVAMRPRKGGKEIQHLASGSFLALHLGPIRTSSSLHAALQHERREFALDIDLTDYDMDKAVRFCACRGNKTACAECWLYAEAAWAAIEYRMSLFCGRTPGTGHEHFLWTYSGCKGLHAWYTDESGDVFGEDARKQIAAYLRFVPTETHGISPEETAYVTYMYTFFLQRISCPARRLLANAATRRWLMAFLHAADDSQIDEAIQPVQRAWGRLAAPSLDTDTPDLFMWAWQTYMPEPPLVLKIRIVQGLLRPRLDEAVLKQSHLLKAPFSIHADTLAIDLPLNTVLLPDARLPQVTVIELEEHAGDTSARSFLLLLVAKAMFRAWLVRRYPALCDKYAVDEEEEEELSNTQEYSYQ